MLAALRITSGHPPPLHTERLLAAVIATSRRPQPAHAGLTPCHQRCDNLPTPLRLAMLGATAAAGTLQAAGAAVRRTVLAGAQAAARQLEKAGSHLRCSGGRKMGRCKHWIKQRACGSLTT